MTPPPAWCGRVGRRLTTMTFELAHKSPVRSSGRARVTSGRKLTGQKPALKMKEVMAIRIRLQMAGKIRELALFNLGIDSKLRG